MRRTFAVAMLCAIYLGALIGHIGFDLYEQSYYRRGRVYRVWLTRTVRRELAGPRRHT